MKLTPNLAVNFGMLYHGIQIQYRDLVVGSVSPLCPFSRCGHGIVAVAWVIRPNVRKMIRQICIDLVILDQTWSVCV